MARAASSAHGGILSWVTPIHERFHNSCDAVACCFRPWLNSLWVFSMHIEPVRYVGDLLYVVAGCPSYPVGLAGNQHQYRLDFVQFQRGVELFCLSWRATPVFLADHKHCRRLDLVHVAEY